MRKNIKFIFMAGIIILAAFMFKNNAAKECGSGVCGLAVPRTVSVVEEADPTAGTEQVTFIELGSKNCVPCKMMQPIMDQIEKDYAGKVKVVFYDVWTEAGKPYARQYRIQAIPTQVFLDKDGKEFYRHMGFLPAEEIVKVLEKQGVSK